MKKFVISMALVGSLFASEFDNLMESLKKEAGVSEFSQAEGEKIFTSVHKDKNGKDISCTSCHTKDLTKSGENIKSGKKMEPLSPKANPNSLTDVKEINKWLKRNFNDVYQREGSAKEKGDVLTYIKNF